MTRFNPLYERGEEGEERNTLGESGMLGVNKLSGNGRLQYPRFEDRTLEWGAESFWYSVLSLPAKLQSWIQAARSPDLRISTLHAFPGLLPVAYREFRPITVAGQWRYLTSLPSKRTWGDSTIADRERQMTVYKLRKLGAGEYGRQHRGMALWNWKPTGLANSAIILVGGE